MSSEEIAPENFVDNREFISFLHNVVKDNISRDQELVHQALIQKDGWLNIADKRSPTYANRVCHAVRTSVWRPPRDLSATRIKRLTYVLWAPCSSQVPDPEDIVGSVRLENGKMLPETYQPMPVHRLVTRNGLFKLSDPLMDALKAASS